MTCHVLFVDDEPENLAVFEAACSERFAVLTAPSAAKGLELMRIHEVGVLLADQRMPGMTGLELLEQVQAQFPQTVRLLVTAYADLDTAVDAINRGRVRRYLRKPWDQDELYATLAEAVDLYQMACKVSALERRLVETERVYSLGVIAAGLARELRSPVAAMNANLVRTREIIRSVGVTSRGDQRAASVARAQLFDADEELAEALVGLGRIVDVVRGIELPTREGGNETADLTEVLRLTMRLIQTELRCSSSLEIDVKPVPPVAGSTAKLGQVVLNLLVNALQAMAWEPRARKTLSIRLAPDDGWVRFEVADSGPGILPELLPRVFDAFSPAGRDRGTSLGLAISKTIVEEIGGHIEAENRPTGGALFRVRLPAMGDTRIVEVPPSSGRIVV